jgi:hypothetical protein
VAVQPVVWNVPLEHAPAPDEARPGRDGQYHGSLWLMVSGSYGVRVLVHGAQGDGIVVVPVTAVAYERLDMPRSLGLLLLGLAGFLAAGLVTIIWSAARESTLPPGETAGPREQRRGWVGLGAGALLVTLMFVGGRSWWTGVDHAHRTRLYHSPEMRATITADRVLRLQVTDSTWLRLRRDRPLVQDEGTVAHVFMISEHSFAHVHPSNPAAGVFEAAIPPLSSGRYQVIAEVVDSTGFSETLRSEVNLGESGVTAGKGDGAWFVDGTPRAREVEIAREESSDLAFRVVNRGKPVPIDWSEPEAAEAVLVSRSGELVHLRPHGTMSLAAIAHFNPGSRPAHRAAPGEVRFPFPASEVNGRTAWVDVRAGKKRLVERFDLPD